MSLLFSIGKSPFASTVSLTIAATVPWFSASSLSSLFVAVLILSISIVGNDDSDSVEMTSRISSVDRRIFSTSPMLLLSIGKSSFSIKFSGIIAATIPSNALSSSSSSTISIESSSSSSSVLVLLSTATIIESATSMVSSRISNKSFTTIRSSSKSTFISTPSLSSSTSASVAVISSVSSSSSSGMSF